MIFDVKGDLKSRHNMAMPVLTPQRLQQHRMDMEGEGGGRVSLVSNGSEAVAAGI